MKNIIYNKLLILEPSSLEVRDETDNHVGHADHIPGKASHFEVKITSKAFNGMPKIKIHQKIYQILKEEMVSDIHALQIDAQPEK